MSAVDIGKEFENHVAELFRKLGYRVLQNTNILGYQIDVFLTYIMPGAIPTQSAVECKYVEKGNLSFTKYQERIGRLKEIRDHRIAQNLIVVTSNGFAENIYPNAKKNNIVLLTISDLENQIGQNPQLTEDQKEMRSIIDSLTPPIIEGALGGGSTGVRMLEKADEQSQMNKWDVVKPILENLIHLKSIGHRQQLERYLPKETIKKWLIQYYTRKGQLEQLEKEKNRG